MLRKRLITPILVLFTAFCLCGCSSTADTPATDSSINKEENTNTLSAISTINLNVNEGNVQISDTLYGLFLEDINFAVDGGLYAELIKNRSFEYGSLAANTNKHGWKVSSDMVSFEIMDGSTDNTALNVNNPHYAILTNTSDDYQGIGNCGYLDGLAVTGGEVYNASLYLRARDSYNGSVRISLRTADGTEYAAALIDSITNEWNKYELELTPSRTINKSLYLYVELEGGSLDVDMISLMPADTYKGLPIRKDIGEYLEALNPSFLRFPGGCAVEGRDEESMYSWKDSIGNALEFTINETITVGDVAARVQGKDIWNGTKQDPYYTTYGIGFYEYFQLCEALDCIPLPILNAGMTCEIQSAQYKVYPLSSVEFAQCVQDALDLVEFCLGDESTYWGSVRIAMGHEEPFELKYIGIGNEQWQSEYHAHYEKFVEAFEAAAKERPELYAGIELIVANGPSSGSTEGWTYIEDYPDSITTLVDEHYYESPTWFLNNTTRYDSYDRSTQAKVFLGEFAAQSNTLQAALAEAAYMTGLERNSDIVAMACYAPLFGNSKNNQWTPDMMFFSNASIYGTANYYVQKLFANNKGTTLLNSTLAVTGEYSQNKLSGGVGLGSWMTSVAYDNIKVTSNTDGSILYQSDFESTSTLKDDGYYEHEGDWRIKNGQLIQTNTGSPFDTNTGDAVYIGDSSWNNYTLTVEGTVTGGSEGFIIPICYNDTGNQIFWNIGGWGNTVSCLQIVSGNSKSGQVSGTVKNLTLKTNQTYDIKVVVNDTSIQCFLDGKLYVNYIYESTDPLYETASIDENGDIILKYVNITDIPIDIKVQLDGIDISKYDATAITTVLSGNSSSDTNSFEEPAKIAPTEGTVTIAESFTYTAPKYSLSIIRIPAK